MILSIFTCINPSADILPTVVLQQNITKQYSCRYFMVFMNGTPSDGGLSRALVFYRIITGMPIDRHLTYFSANAATVIAFRNSVVVLATDGSITVKRDKPVS